MQKTIATAHPEMQIIVVVQKLDATVVCPQEEAEIGVRHYLKEMVCIYHLCSEKEGAVNT